MVVILLLLAIISATPPARAGSISGNVICPACRNIRDTIVYIENISRASFKSPITPVVMDQIDLNFEPHVLPVLMGTTVVFPNSDDVRHNVFSPSRSKRFNLGTYPKKETRQMVFDKPGEVVLLCNVHAEMSAYLLVLETPYFTQVDPDGNFLLKNISSGTYKVTAWSESYQSVSKEVKVSDTESTRLDFRFIKEK